MMRITASTTLVAAVLAAALLLRGATAQATIAPPPTANATTTTTAPPQAEAPHAHAPPHDLKAIAMATLFTASVLVAGVVMVVPGCHTNPLILSLAACFSAGVFLVVGVAHMFPEAEDLIRAFFGADSHVAARYLPAHMLLLAGYSFMLFVERVVFAGGHDHSGSSQADNDASVDGGSVPGLSAEPSSHVPHGPRTDSEGSSVVATPQATTSHTAASEPIASSTASTTKTAAVPVDDSDLQQQQQQHQLDATKMTPAVAAAVVPKSDAVSALIALFVHSAIEGTALGIQKERAGVLILFLAILAHQWGEDFAVAVATGRAGYATPKRVLMSVVLALGCPTGIALGWAFSEGIPDVGIGYTLAFSTGTFVSIACSSIVPAEMPHGSRQPLRLGFTVLGMACMYAVIVAMYGYE